MKKLFVSLLLAAAACGGPSQKEDPAVNVELAECTYTLPEGSSEADVQPTLEAINDGSIDPCDGSLSSTMQRVSVARLIRVDFDQEHGTFRMVLGIYGPATLRP